jgi:hypothetical protein
MRIVKKWYFIAPLAILAMVLFAYVGGEIVMHLWNWLVPSLFGWREITFWQALGLLVLCRILFGGHGMHGPKHSGMGRRMRERMEERWAKMTPEEREKARQRWARCSPFEPPDVQTEPKTPIG